MTAPLFNLPITAPITGGAAGPNAGQGALGGFEALLAAFFGGQGAEAAAGLFGDAAGDTGAATDKPAKADLEDKTSPTDPLALAAMLVTTPAPIAAVAVAVAAADAAFGGKAAPAAQSALPTADGAAPTLAAPPMTADQAAAAAGAEAGALTKAAADQTALGAPTGEAANVAAKLPGAITDKPEASPAPTPNSPARPAQAQAQAPQTPQIQPPQAAPQAEAPTAQQGLALAEAAAAEPEAEAPVAEPHAAAPRAARHADAARKAGTEAGVAPVADDAVLPTAVAQAQGVETAAEPASALETEAEAASADTPDIQLPPQAAAAAQAHAAATPHGPPVHATSETIANLTAQIGKKLEGRSTKFDVELTPAGLGQVNISVEIAASGKMTAAMSFESPQAAAELRARSHELQRALEQAGFDLSGGLSFDVAGDQGRQAQQQSQQNDGAAWRGRAFQAVLGTAGEAAETAAHAALQYSRRSDTGVDIRI